MGAFTIGDDGSLASFCEALGCALMGRVDELVADHDGRPGWQPVFDPDSCPSYALPYLSQFVGTELESRLTEADQRQAIRVPAGWGRGTRQAMIEAVQRTLTGTKNVSVLERYGDDAYALAVRVLASEQAVSPSETERAALSQKPIGLSLTYLVEGGETWDDLTGRFSTWDDVTSSGETWFDVAHDAP
jgi:hypothetical protein